MTILNMKSLKDLLPRTFHPAVLKQMQADSVCQAAEQAIKAVLPDYTSEIMVKYFKDGQVFVGVSSSVLGAELRFQEKRILEKLHRFLRQEGVVEKLVVRM